MLLLLRQLWLGPSFSRASAHLAAACVVQLMFPALLFKWPLVYWSNR